MPSAREKLQAIRAGRSSSAHEKLAAIRATRDAQTIEIDGKKVLGGYNRDTGEIRLPPNADQMTVDHEQSHKVWFGGSLPKAAQDEWQKLAARSHSAYEVLAQSRYYDADPAFNTPGTLAAARADLLPGYRDQAVHARDENRDIDSLGVESFAEAYAVYRKDPRQLPEYARTFFDKPQPDVRGRAREKLAALRARTPLLEQLDLSEERQFRAWYAQQAARTGLSPDPDDPRHRYDYRAAFRAGAELDEQGHWPSQFKADDHPNRFIGGVDTKTGAPKARTPLLDEMGVTGEEVKRRAAAGQSADEIRAQVRRELTAGGTPTDEATIERITQQRALRYAPNPLYREPTHGEANLSGIVAGVTGLGEGAIQAATVPLDLAMSPGKGLAVGARFAREGVGGALDELLPATTAVTRRADKDLATSRRAVGVPDEAITDVWDATLRLGGNIAAPGPGVKVGGKLARGAARHAAEEVIGEVGPKLGGGPMRGDLVTATVNGKSFEGVVKKIVDDPNLGPVAELATQSGTRKVSLNSIEGSPAKAPAKGADSLHSGEPVPVSRPQPRGPGALTPEDALLKQIDDLPDVAFPKLKDLGPLESKGISLPDPRRAANVLDKGEDGLVRRTFIDPVEKAVHARIRETKALQDRVKAVTKGIKKGSEEDQLIRKYGERRTYPENFTPEDAAKITPQIIKADQEFRAMFDDMFARLNKSREIAGQAPIPYREDYYTRAEELGALRSLFGSLEHAPEFVLGTRYAKPNAPFFQFALPRTGTETSAGAIEGFTRYMQPALETIHYAEPIVAMRQNAKFLPPNAQRYFSDWADSLARKHELVDEWAGPVANITGALRRLTSRGLILGNIGTALLQPSSVASTISRTGRHSLSALPETFSATGKEFARKYSGVVAGRRFDPDIDPDMLGQVGHVLGYALQTLDEIIARHAFLSAFKKGTKEGKDFVSAIRYADDITAKTQNDMRREFSAPLMRSEIGGTLGQLQSFTINFYNQVRRDIPAIARDQGKMEAFKVAVTLGTSVVAINKIYKEAGLREPFDVTTGVPFAGSLKYGEPPPALQGAFGTVQAATGLVTGDKRLRQAGTERMIKGGLAMIPAGRQAQKSYQGIQAARAGGVRSKKGKWLYPVEGPMEVIRAVLFGPSGTKAATRYRERRKAVK